MNAKAITPEQIAKVQRRELNAFYKRNKPGQARGNDKAMFDSVADPERRSILKRALLSANRIHDNFRSHAVLTTEVRTHVEGTGKRARQYKVSSVVLVDSRFARGNRKSKKK